MGAFSELSWNAMRLVLSKSGGEQSGLVCKCSPLMLYYLLATGYMEQEKKDSGKYPVFAHGYTWRGNLGA